MDIILASRSPRRPGFVGTGRSEGLQGGLPDVDEHIEGNPSPAHLVEALSQRKAQAVLAGADEDDLIIAADTVVVLDGAVLGKPADEREAFAMLSALSGNSHRVYTGVTVAQGDRMATEHEETRVTFRELEPEEISCYIATGEPMDKAGAYGIQGVGALLVSGIKGDYCNVMAFRYSGWAGCWPASA